MDCLDSVPTSVMLLRGRGPRGTDIPCETGFTVHETGGGRRASKRKLVDSENLL